MRDEYDEQREPLRRVWQRLPDPSEFLAHLLELDMHDRLQRRLRQLRRGRLERLRDADLERRRCVWIVYDRVRLSRELLANVHGRSMRIHLQQRLGRLHDRRRLRDEPQHGSVSLRELPNQLPVPRELDANVLERDMRLQLQ